MKVNFKELLGELYSDEIAGVLEPLESMLINNTNNTYIPKERFDQVNTQRKNFESELEKIRLAKLTDEEKAAEANAKMLEANKALQSELNLAKISKLFADSGIKEYESILKGVVTDDFEKSEALANSILTTMKLNVDERDKEIEKLKVGGTPKPDGIGGSGADQIRTNYTYTELAELKAKDPAKYEQIITIKDKK